MKHCNECDVKIITPAIYCPLCYSYLSENLNETAIPLYPNLATKAETYNIVLRILLFVSLTVGTVCATINYLTFREQYWSVVVIASIIYVWVSVATMIKGRGKVGRNILVQVVNAGGLITIISMVFSFKNVVFTYVLPGLFIFATLCISIVVIMKQIDAQSFILYFIVVALLGFIPLLLVQLKLATVAWPSVVSAVYSGLSLVSLLIFADNATKREFKKRFHL